MISAIAKIIFSGIVVCLILTEIIAMVGEKVMSVN